jgi:hypothetical protein
LQIGLIAHKVNGREPRGIFYDPKRKVQAF